jgi:hypothetical protein
MIRRRLEESREHECFNSRSSVKFIDHHRGRVAMMSEGVQGFRGMRAARFAVPGSGVPGCWNTVPSDIAFIHGVHVTVYCTTAVLPVSFDSPHNPFPRSIYTWVWYRSLARLSALFIFISL